MSRRYFIKTFGCQMNEYDSARMADVLGAAAGLTATMTRSLPVSRVPVHRVSHSSKSFDQA